MPHVIRLRQQGAAWLAWRRQGLGGSDAAAILALSPWCSPRQLWERRTGRLPEEPATFAMRRGSRLEPLVRNRHAALFGRRLEPCCLQDERRPWLRCSADGLSLDGELALEIKCPNLEAHKTALEGQLPAYYVPQVQHLLAVSGARICHYCSWSEHRMFDARSRLAVVLVEPSAQYQAQLAWAMSCFWLAIRLDYWPEGGPPLPASWPLPTQRLLTPGASCTAS